jgi:hypothetical protein
LKEKKRILLNGSKGEKETAKNFADEGTAA